MGIYRKILLVLFLFLLSLPGFTGDNQNAFYKNIKAGDKIVLKGYFCIYNGFPPNVRFVTQDCRIIGIGKGEASDNEEVDKIIDVQLKNNIIYEAEVEFKYIETIKVDDFQDSLMCFSVSKIKILSYTINYEKLTIKIQNLKLNEKKGKLTAKLEIFNSSSSPSEYTNKNLFIKNTKHRAYEDTPASVVVDFEYIQIPPQTAVQRNIYFFPEDFENSSNAWYDMIITYSDRDR